MVLNRVAKLLKDTDFTELIKGSGIAFVLKIAGIAVSYVFTVIVTHHYGAEVWGMFSISLMFFQILGMIGRFGSDLALLRFISELMASKNKQLVSYIFQKTLLLVLLISSFLSVFLFLMAKVLAIKIFHNFNLILPLKITSFFIVPFVVLWVTREAIRGLKKIAVYMVLQQFGVFALSSLMLISFTFLLGSPDFTLISRYSCVLPVLSYGISILFFAFVAVFLWNRYVGLLPEHNRPVIDKQQFSYKDILMVSLPFLFSNMLVFIMGWTDTFMIGIFKTTEDVGVYNVALKLSTLISIVLFSVNSIAAPKFAEFWGRKDIEGLAKVARQSARLIFWASLPVLLIFLFYPKQILLIFGKTFTNASVALIILSIGQFINAIVGSVGYILMMTGKEKVMQNVILGGAVINVVFNAFLIPRYGINGAALASALSLAFINIVPLFLVKKYYGFYTINIV